MKYRYVDRLDAFDFNDSRIFPVSWDEGGLTVSAEMLNVRRDKAPEPFDFDMEIRKAYVSFLGFKLLSFAYHEKVDGANPYGTAKLTEYTGKTALEAFEKQISIGAYVQLIEYKDGVYYWSGQAEEPFFYFSFECDSTVVEWDEYEGLAWHEQKRIEPPQISVTLSTPNGDKKCDFSLTKREESNSVCLQYNGESYIGCADEYRFEAAFADLQRKLPEGVKIKCCLTCRHGNFDPCGSEGFEIFCLNGAEIKSKNDVLDCIDNSHKCRSRSRKIYGVCEKYEAQSEGCTVYNDFMHFLKKNI